jgi:spore maturation protein CgeB
MSLDIAFFGSSLVSSWWNGSCTYYRGILRGLHELGHRVTFYEPVAYERQEHRDIPDPDWAKVVIYEAPDEAAVRAQVEQARGVDMVVKTSGVGVFDDVLEDAVLSLGAYTVFWDVDAPATLSRMEADPDDSFRALLPSYDLVLTYGGGEPVVRRYTDLGARECLVVYNALDPTTHFPAAADPRFEVDLALLANRLPDREARIEEFFLRPASLLPDRTFLLAGNGWGDKPVPPNVRLLGHVGTADHNAFNSTPLAVSNVTRDSMVANGWSPATRVFEVAGAAACQITDGWEGLSDFLVPDREVLVAYDGQQVADHLRELDRSRATLLGKAALERVLSEHTYGHRAVQVDQILRERIR